MAEPHNDRSNDRAMRKVGSNRGRWGSQGLADSPV